MTTKKQLKIDDARINSVFNKNCSGIQIDIFDISKVFKVGHAAIAAGADDAELAKQVVAFVETIRTN